MDYAKLKTELTTDPNILGYSVGLTDGDDGAVLGILNTPRYQTYGLVPVWKVQSWAMTNQYNGNAGESVYFAIQQASGSPQDPNYALCKQIVDTFAARFDNLDFSLPWIQGVIAALLAASIVTQAQHDELLALGVVSISRAEQLFGSNVSMEDIIKAKN